MKNGKVYQIWGVKTINYEWYRPPNDTAEKKLWQKKTNSFYERGGFFDRDKLQAPETETRTAPEES